MSISGNYNQQLSNGYYKLASESSATSATGGNDNVSTQPNKTPSMTSAFFLSLSPEAQAYLNSVGLNQTVSTNTSTSSFILTDEQQSTLDGIITKYKGEPFTQTTFDKIQSDLHSAGLSPNQLAQQAQVKDFNPTAELVAALNGKDTSSSTETDDSKADASRYDAQKNNYIQKITDAFKKIAAPMVDAA